MSGLELTIQTRMPSNSEKSSCIPNIGCKDLCHNTLHLSQNFCILALLGPVVKPPAGCCPRERIGDGHLGSFKSSLGRRVGTKEPQGSCFSPNRDSLVQNIWCLLGFYDEFLFLFCFVLLLF